MTRVIIDADLQAKLLNFRQPLELCDSSGQVLAHLVPSLDLSAYEMWEPPYDEAELERREQSDKWHTTAEVLDHLRKLGNE